jgi:hypothetical protein
MAKLYINYKDNYGNDLTRTYFFNGNKSDYDNWMLEQTNYIYNRYMAEYQARKRQIDLEPRLIEQDKARKVEERIKSIKEKTSVDVLDTPVQEVIEDATNEIRKEMNTAAKIKGLFNKDYA